MCVCVGTSAIYSSTFIEENDCHDCIVSYLYRRIIVSRFRQMVTLWLQFNRFMSFTVFWCLELDSNAWCLALDTKYICSWYNWPHLTAIIFQIPQSDLSRNCWLKMQESLHILCTWMDIITSFWAALQWCDSNDIYFLLSVIRSYLIHFNLQT